MTDEEQKALRADLGRAEQALADSLAGLDDQSAHAPSELPGWSRGHVLTHLARNAETFCDGLDAIGRGDTLTMYGGSVEQRNTDIEQGAGRPAAELRVDVESTSGGLGRRLADLTAEQWSGHVRHLRGELLLTVSDVVSARWQEVEIHRIDLGLGYRPADWPAAFVARHLPAQLARLPQRAPDVQVPDLPAYEVLGWLYGRGRADLPELPPWP